MSHFCLEDQMQYELVETINGKEVVTAEFPASSLSEAQYFATMMKPTGHPSVVRLSKEDQDQEELAMECAGWCRTCRGWNCPSRFGADCPQVERMWEKMMCKGCRGLGLDPTNREVTCKICDGSGFN